MCLLCTGSRVANHAQPCLHRHAETQSTDVGILPTAEYMPIPVTHSDPGGNDHKMGLGTHWTRCEIDPSSVRFGISTRTELIITVEVHPRRVEFLPVEKGRGASFCHQGTPTLSRHFAICLDPRGTEMNNVALF